MMFGRMCNMIYNDIKGYRKRNGITQVQLAEKLGITQSAVSKMEKSGSLKTINKVAKVFNTDAMELIGTKDV